MSVACIINLIPPLDEALGTLQAHFRNSEATVGVKHIKAQ